MRVLMIGRDPNIFIVDSAVRQRLKILALHAGEIVNITFTKANEGVQEVKDNVLTIIPTNSRSPWLYVWDAFRLGRLQSPPDLITSQDPFLAGLVGLMLKRFLKVPLEIQLHTDVAAKSFRYFSVKNFIYYCLARLILPRPNKVRVVSNKLKEELLAQKWVKDSRVYILPIFMSSVEAAGDPVWLSKVPAGHKIILMAGRLEPEKRYHLALQALAKLADKKVILAIAGAGALFANLEAEAVRLGVNKRVLWLGQLSPEEMARSYAAADLFLHAAAYEGYGLVLAEAARAGLPIISTDVGVAKEAGALIVAPTALAIAMGLTAALKHPPVSQMPPIATEDDYLHTLTREWQLLLN